MSSTVCTGCVWLDLDAPAVVDPDCVVHGEAWIERGCE